jgi:hypothetical protein
LKTMIMYNDLLDLGSITKIDSRNCVLPSFCWCFTTKTFLFRYRIEICNFYSRQTLLSIFKRQIIGTKSPFKAEAIGDKKFHGPYKRTMGAPCASTTTRAKHEINYGLLPTPVTSSETKYRSRK